MADSKPGPFRWTLRFKNHNITILLLISPAEPFENVKSKLLDALRVRGIQEINGVQVPESASEVELGIPLDRNNLEKGWVRLKSAAEQKEEKQDPSSAAKKNIVVDDTPQGANLRDSQAVAFRFRAANNEGDAAGGAEMDVNDEAWDVVIPTFEDDE
ncbi:hypothetical protein LOZ18_004759 [Ophidiomyces ophidiicola]|nr:hypothetical protein LOZ18_004759 [Ophidiomyces ophidiicola]